MPVGTISPPEHTPGFEEQHSATSKTCTAPQNLLDLITPGTGCDACEGWGVQFRETARHIGPIAPTGGHAAIGQVETLIVAEPCKECV